MNAFLTSLHAVHCLLMTTGGKDKLSIIKLLFLADKYQLLHIGRTITRNKYVAMKYGPVLSQVLDLLDDIEGTRSDLNKCDVDTSSIIIEDGIYKTDASIEYDELSDSDIEAIKYICDTYKDKNSRQLVEYTHRFPEWQQYSEHFKNSSKCKDIDEREMLSIIDDKLDTTEDDIKLLCELKYGV